MDFVSVITAVYNGEEYLEEAIESILCQTYKNFEYIIVNDGSTDRTSEILSQISDYRVKVINLEKNKGAANALNVGIEASKGKWIAIQDADDISFPNRIEEQIKFLSNHHDVEALGSFIQCIPGNYSINRRMKRRLKAEEKSTNRLKAWKELKEFRFYGNPFCHGSMMFSKRLFDTVGPYDTQYKIAYDYDLWMRMFEKTKIMKIPIQLYGWRVNFDSLCRADQLETCNEVNKISSKYIGEYCFSSSSDPKVNVVGTEKACENFKQNIVSHTNVTVSSYYDVYKESEIELLYNDSKEENVNGIIVLDGNYSEVIMKRLQEKGMIANKDLFLLWSVV